MQSIPRTYLPLITFVALPNCHWVVSIHLPWSWSYQCAPITLQWLYTPPPFAYRQVATNHFFNENTLRPRGSSSNPRPIGFYQQHNFALLTYRTLISSGCFDQPSFGLWARRASSAPRWFVWHMPHSFAHICRNLHCVHFRCHAWVVCAMVTYNA